MEIFGGFVVPESTLYLLGVLGLLVIWQYHHIQVLAGRIYAVDFWDVSGIRMFLHATTQDGHACRSCKEANGTVFLPSLATKKNFSTLKHPCSNPSGCRCMIVGLYGGWPEANRIVKTLRKEFRKKPMNLSDKQVINMFEGPWQQSISATSDRLTIHMLEAMHLEGSDIEGALFRYRYVVEQARGARDLNLVVPAYLRLVELLERAKKNQEALEVVSQFEKRFARKKSVFYYPKDAQRDAMSSLKSRLLSRVHRQPAQQVVAS